MMQTSLIGNPRLISGAGSQQANSPHAFYEQALGNLEKHIRDLPNPVMFRKFTMKLLGLVDEHFDIAQGISDEFAGQDFPAETIRLLKDFDLRVKNLGEQDLTYIRNHLRQLADIKVESAPSLPKLFQMLINPDPLTKKGIQENNRQISLVYTDKQGIELKFIPCGYKTAGCAYGTLFRKETSEKHWIGKIGESRGIIQKYGGILFEEINMDVIFEKLATDLYMEFGRGYFKLPKTRLSLLPLHNEYGPHQPRWPMGDSMYQFICENKDKSSLRIMSKFVEGYHNFKDAFTVNADGLQIPFMQFIKDYHRPPDQLLTPGGELVPLCCFIEMMAVGRILCDTDILGGTGDNAGFVWVVEDEKIIRADTVKIDTGRGFNMDANEEESVPNTNCWVLNTVKGFDGKKLKSPKDIQTAQNYAPTILVWKELMPSQRDIFLGVLFNASRYLKKPDILEYLFYRDGKFHKSDVAELPKRVAQKFQKDLNEWLNLQFEIYQDDLARFHQKHPEQALRAHYIDSCGELSLPMKKETFPIRELFTDLAIVDGKQSKEDKRMLFRSNKILCADPPEVDSIKETMDRIDLCCNKITLEQLFESSRRVLLIGRAGIGKSTLCQKIAHDWASGRLWNDLFQAVYWLPLRNLNDLKVCDDPEDFLVNHAIPHQLGKIATIEDLCAQINTKKNLLILDGYDEANPELSHTVEQILKCSSFHILVTSRPGSVSMLEVDQIVENIGFSDEQIKSYISKFSKRYEKEFIPEEKGHDLFTTINYSASLYPIAHVPLQLQMIVALSENKENISNATSLTKLYQTMTEELYCWCLRGQNLDEKDTVFTSLGRIALIGLEHGKLIIPHEKIDHLINETLLEAGILKKIEGETICYQFIHLTFQEYLAAYYIRNWSQGAKKFFILTNRMKPNYQLVFAFLVGLIYNDPHMLQEFFNTLYADSKIKRLSTSYLVELTLRCLNECVGFENHIPAIDAFNQEYRDIWNVRLFDRKHNSIVLAALQKQSQALRWLGSHYSHLLQTTIEGDGATVLHLSAATGDVDSIKWLLQTDPSLISKVDYGGNTPLHSAAVMGYLEAMKLLLQADPSLISKYTPCNVTPLHYAAESSSIEAMKLLLSLDRSLASKANINSVTPFDTVVQSGNVEAIKLLLQADPSLISKYQADGTTPLHCVAYDGNVEAIEVLLKADSSLTSKYKTDGTTPLHYAAKNGYVEAIKLLLKTDPSLTSKYDTNGTTPLHYAARNGHIEAIEVLLQADPSLTSKYNTNGTTPFHDAAWNSHDDAIKLLLQADPSIISKYLTDGTTPLHLAALYGSTKTINLLLQADPSLISKYRTDGTTPLHQASRTGNVKAIKLLLQIDPSLISKYTYDDTTALHCAVEDGNTEAIMLLLQADPSLASKANEKGDSPFDAALKRNKVEVMKSLLQANPLLASSVDEWGVTLLHKSAEKGNVETMKLLLQTDPSLISKCTCEGDIPLHYAATSNNIEAMGLLFLLDPLLISKTNSDAYTPFHIVVENGNLEAMKLFLHADPSLASTTISGDKSPLHMATRYNNIEAIKLLLPLDPSLASKVDKHGQTPFDTAIERANVEAVKLFLQADSSLISKVDKDCCTPLHTAALKDNVEVMKLLLQADPSRF